MTRRRNSGGMAEPATMPNFKLDLLVEAKLGSDISVMNMVVTP